MLRECLSDYGADTVPGRAYGVLAKKLTPSAGYDEVSHSLVATAVFHRGMEFVRDSLGDPHLQGLGEDFMRLTRDRQIGIVYRNTTHEALRSIGFVGDVPDGVAPQYPQVIKIQAEKPYSTKILLPYSYLDIFFRYPMSALAITVEFASKARDSALERYDGESEARSEAAVAQVIKHSLKDPVQGNLNPNYYCLELYPNGIEDLPEGVWY